MRFSDRFRRPPGKTYICQHVAVSAQSESREVLNPDKSLLSHLISRTDQPRAIRPRGRGEGFLVAIDTI